MMQVKTASPISFITLFLLYCTPLCVAAASDEAPAGEAGGLIIPEHPALSDRFTFMLGGYYPDTVTEARLDPNSGAGAIIDFEEAFGLDSQKLVLEGAFRWRFAERWRLEANYFSLNRTATRVLEREIDWGDETFLIGESVDTRFKISDLRTAVGYSFFRRQDKELGIGLGLHASKFLASLEGSGGAAEATDVTAPLPVINFYATTAFTDAWAMSTRLDWLSMSYEDFSGDVRYVALDFLYQPFESVGFGFGYHGLLYNLEMDSNDWHGSVKQQLHGLAAFMSVSF